MREIDRNLLSGWCWWHRALALIVKIFSKWSEHCEPRISGFLRFGLLT